MEKAILILDKMPKSCADCPICCWSEETGLYNCLNGTKKEKCVDEYLLDDRLNKPIWCPLKLIPKKLVVKEINTVEDFMHSDIMSAINKITAKISLDTDLLIASGYNACIDEILGEE